MTQTSVHRGEIEARVRSGVEDPRRLGASLTGEIPDKAAEFLGQQRLFFIALSNPDDVPWGTVVTGCPGFIYAPDSRSIQVEALPQVSDPVFPLLRRDSSVGAIAIEFETRRRMRANGIVDHVGERSFRIGTQQVYSNCSQYINARIAPDSVERAGGTAEEISASDVVEFVRRADTVFLGTEAPGEGVDMSHRGGMPGFMKAIDRPGTGVRILVPDYRGNRFFNSFGNLAVNPLASLLIPDFTTGDTVHLGGEATVDYDSSLIATLPGAQRVLVFDVRTAVRVAGNLPRDWVFDSYSPLNPVSAGSGDSGL